MRHRWSIAFACTLALALVAPGVAAADDPPFVGYTEFLPPLPGTYEPSSGDGCRSGRLTCVDKVNVFLNRVTAALYPELAGRFDPTVDDLDLPGWLDDMATFQAFPVMRETAWRNAERLAAAKTPLARALVEQSIELSATTTANAIALATATTPQQHAARNAFCAAHHDDVV